MSEDDTIIIRVDRVVHFPFRIEGDEGGASYLLRVDGKYVVRNILRGDLPNVKERVVNECVARKIIKQTLEGK